MSYQTLLIDSPSLIYRAYFAVPNSICDPDGNPVNAIRGYLDMVTNIVQQYQPKRVVHCFDNDWRPGFRVAAYPGYKAQRVAADDAEEDPVTAQMDSIRELLDLVGAESAEAEGFEADDVIATIASDKKTAIPIGIVTGDRDLFALVRDGSVTVLYTVSGVKNLRVVDNADVQERYGVPANRYADFAILRGDPSDGLPGIRGVGPKGAAELVNRFPSIEALIAGADQLSPKLATSIGASADYLRCMLNVVPLRRDAPVELSRSERAADKAAEFGTARNVASPIQRLLETWS